MSNHLDSAPSTPGDDGLRQGFAVSFGFPVLFTRDAFASDNDTLARALLPEADGVRRRVLVCLDAGLVAAQPDLEARVAARLDGLEGIDRAGDALIVPGGEAAKQGLAAVETVARAAAERNIDRQSYVLAVGGGAMLDAVGLGAALVHRGVRLVRMPSTVLAQNDAGIGVKNGVNAFGQKNFLGCFAPPHAVVNDLDLLLTLSDRDWRAGIAEAVKVALIADAAFFADLEHDADRLRARDAEAMADLVWRCAGLHIRHTGTSGDPFETGSARPLDFGHWSAHWLESATRGAVSHGEAVAIGISLDAFYAQTQGWLTHGERARIHDLFRQLGLPRWHDELERCDPGGRPAVFEGIERFREHLGGQLTVTFPDGIGRRLDVHSVDLQRIAFCLRQLQALAG